MKILGRLCRTLFAPHNTHVNGSTTRPKPCYFQYSIVTVLPL